MRPVGILGGMGPEATVLLQQKLIAHMPAQDDADHIPLLIDMNPQVPSRIAHLIEGTGEDPGPTLAAMARRLEGAGAVALAMPCNTAHHYAPHIEGAVDIPFLNMIDLAVQYAARVLPQGGKVGMLGSPAVRQVKLFDTPLAAVGLGACWPEDDQAMLQAIRWIKKGEELDTARATLRAASEELLARGAALQFVACSEFSIIADSTAPSAQPVDTVDLLVAAIKDAAQV